MISNVTRFPFKFPKVERNRWSGKIGASSPTITTMAWALKLPLTDEVIESGLAQDFDASLSGIGQELGAGAYSMRYALSSDERSYCMFY